MRRLGNALLVTMLTCGLVVTPVFAEPSIDSLKKNKEAKRKWGEKDKTPKSQCGGTA